VRRAYLLDGERARSHAQRRASEDGHFAPGSVIRRVGDTPLVPLLGGAPAVLLQMAHPLVAAGVVAHSDYRNDVWRRLYRTMRALYLIVYGSREEADAAAAAVRAVHARVRGRTDVQLGPFPPGTPYSACDQELMLWVHASLVEIGLAAYQRFVATLEPAEEEAFYREMGLVASLFGIRADVLPPTLRDFRDYLDARLRSPEICVTEPAREVAAVVLAAPLPAPLRLLLPAYRLATAALLPPRLRDAYGLAWSPLHAAALALAGRALRGLAVPLFRAAELVAPPPVAYGGADLDPGGHPTSVGDLDGYARRSRRPDHARAGAR
jgi:uncharacterized protein (DUF2236 family)